MTGTSSTAALNEILEHLDIIELGGVAIIIILFIIFIAIATKGESKNEKQAKYEQQQKIISELQNITSRQQEFIKKLRETNDHLYRQTVILNEIQKQTRPESFEEKEELKKKIQEINKMMKV